jgi:hypothetical protein
MDWWHPLAWDWATLAKSALGAGFGTAAMTGILSVYRDTHHRKSQAAYMAMRLAVTLEPYAYACSEFIAENANMQARLDQEFPDWNTSLPELSVYPDDIEGWRAIDRKLAGIRMGDRVAYVGIKRLFEHLGQFMQSEIVCMTHHVFHDGTGVRIDRAPSFLVLFH